MSYLDRFFPKYQSSLKAVLADATYMILTRLLYGNYIGNICLRVISKLPLDRFHRHVEAHQDPYLLLLWQVRRTFHFQGGLHGL